MTHRYENYLKNSNNNNNNFITMVIIQFILFSMHPCCIFHQTSWKTHFYWLLHTFCRLAISASLFLQSYLFHLFVLFNGLLQVPFSWETYILFMLDADRFCCLCVKPSLKYVTFFRIGNLVHRCTNVLCNV